MGKKVVHFGAGKIGRGLMGPIYFDSGVDIVYVDVLPNLVKALNERTDYRLDVITDPPYSIVISGFCGLLASEREHVAEAIANTDLVSTAVGKDNLSDVAMTLSLAVDKRRARGITEPLNILIVENMVSAGSNLRNLVLQHTSTTALSHTGFVECSTGRVVPPITDAMIEVDPLWVRADGECLLIADAAGFSGVPPSLAYVEVKDNFAAYTERKLFVYNMAHAITAYLGYLRGYTYVWEAIGDPVIARTVNGAVDEAKAALVTKHGFDPAELDAYAKNIVGRFHNRALGDTLARVGRDPVRKLSPDDRLVGAARMCLENGVTPSNIACGIAAALRYDYSEDPSAGRLGELIAEGRALSELCQIVPGDSLAELIELAEPF